MRVSTRFEVLGELGLYGEIRPVRGALSAAIAAGQAGRGIIVPLQNRQEAALAHGVDVRAVQHLDEACALLNSPDGAIGTIDRMRRARCRRSRSNSPTSKVNSRRNAHSRSPLPALIICC